VIELIPESYVAPLDLENLRTQRAVAIDLGCGTFVPLRWRSMPDKFSRNRTVVWPNPAVPREKPPRLAMCACCNGKLLCGALPVAGRVSRNIYLLFPIHGQNNAVIIAANRLEILRAIMHRARGMAPSIYLATDHLIILKEIKVIARANPDFTVEAPFERSATSGPDGRVLPLTKFERQFRAQSAAIYWQASKSFASEITLRFPTIRREAHGYNAGFILAKKFDAARSQILGQLSPIRSFGGKSREVAMIRRGRTTSRRDPEQEFPE
jgi:hypothetical protein